MPHSINPTPVIRLCAFRSRTAPLRTTNVAFRVTRPACRTFAEDKSKDLPKAPPGTAGPNMNQQEHVSEEAAKMAKIQGGQGPDIEGQGTPVEEILQNEKEFQKQAPQVMKEQINSGKPPTKPSTRPFSTLARRQLEVTPSSSDLPSSLDASMLPSAAQQSQFSAELLQPTLSAFAVTTPSEGHKFPLPTLPLPKELVKTHRYDPVVLQVTNLLMRDGKKATAQRNMAFILNVLRTAPAPTYSATRTLLPGAPPASHLPLNPILYLTLAIDSVAPLMRIRTQRGAAGGGAALQIPVPLLLRQRRRTAFKWILDAAVKRTSRGSGRNMFAQKVADELIAVVEGRSGVWERRNAVHKLGTTARTNLAWTKGGSRGRR